MEHPKKNSMKDMFQELNKAYELMSLSAPDFFRDFMSFLDSTERKGVLSEKTKALISIALAIDSHCLPCISFHVSNAIDSGATKQEIMEASEIAVLMGGSPAFVYLKNVLDACEEFGAD
jgi:AhpD family alkylhydroperoxidase